MIQQPTLSSLLLVELRRAFARRLVRVVAMVALAGILITTIWLAIWSKPPSPELEAQRARALQECVDGRTTPWFFEGDVEGRPGDPGPPVGSAERRDVCEHYARSVTPSPSALRLSTLGGTLIGTGIVLVLVGLVVGASLIAAEWRAGTLALQLTWEPRRVRVFLTKLLAAIAVAVALSIAVQTLLALVIWLIASTRGVVDHVDIAEIAGRQGRLLVLVAIGSAFGFAIGSIGKNTAAALGVIAGYLLIVENLLGFIRWLFPWQLRVNGVAWVAGGIEFQLGFDEAGPVMLERSGIEGLIVLLVYAGVAVAVALTMLRSRDVLS